MVIKVIGTVIFTHNLSLYFLSINKIATMGMRILKTTVIIMIVNADFVIVVNHPY